MRIMLTTEGTYPFHQGGVSTWCDSIVKKINDVDFVLYSIIMNPFVTQKFTLPPRAELIKVPLWGTEEPSEHLTIPFSQVYLSKKNTVDSVIKEKFIPLFKELIDEIFSKEKDYIRFGNVLVELHRYFESYEYKNSFKSKITWDVYKEYTLKFTRSRESSMAEPNLYALIQSLGWIYRFLNILNTPIPDVHVTHSAAAAFCGIPPVLAKLKNKSPFLLTEHGVYLREQYLSLSQRDYPSFLNTFMMRLIHSVAGLSYEFADQVSPVCQYNTRWEKEFGVNPDNIKVIYNGVDKKVFTPGNGVVKNKYPTVVCVARIDPIKDIKTLLLSAAKVVKAVPDARFIVYGSVSVHKYYDECMQLRSELGLNENFIFAGHVSDVPSAYRSGDIVVLSSISEAFPYSVVEAMMVGKPLVATDVGGIKEALGDAGMLVKPRDPDEMAQSIINLINSPYLRETMGNEARERALNLFTIERFTSLYLKSYINLAAGQRKVRFVADRNKRQKLYFERGLALLEISCYREAVKQLKLAAKQAYDSPAVPVILTAIAQAYNNLGMFDHAFNEMEKARALAEILEGTEYSA
jgi:glycosyltransferase involved in cell wall biosynthesis